MGKYALETKIAPKWEPPVEFLDLKPTLDQFQDKLDAITTSKAGETQQMKREAANQITQLHHQRNRYLYNVYYKRRAISKSTWEWMVRWKYVDVDLVAKWRKQGYEQLCCLDCIGNTVCVCRVPLSVRKMEDGDGVPDPCTRCGCVGCASGD